MCRFYITVRSGGLGGMGFSLALRGWLRGIRGSLLLTAFLGKLRMGVQGFLALGDPHHLLFWLVLLLVWLLIGRLLGIILAATSATSVSLFDIHII
jgi:hypothetical protein